ncbi:Uu.00g031530.m01.CDS01 [Anthostomella pinea]|uniref:Uu.00g031530.m01.CDS01 n=1 Tax=Anthostomella pinea TaxID=933095 RepID=A0AAI8V8J0_9PEZI|nr:Uu.00g031530.m01.CDS01 [Anthostomella pinea]
MDDQLATPPFIPDDLYDIYRPGYIPPRILWTTLDGRFMTINLVPTQPEGPKEQSVQTLPGGSRVWTDITLFQRSNHWEAIVSEILKFVKCSNECHRRWENTDYPSIYLSTRQFSRCSQTNHTRVHDEWRELMRSEGVDSLQSRPREWWEIRGELVGDEPVKAPNDGPCPILDPPTDVFTMIFEHAAEAPELHAHAMQLKHRGQPTNESTQLIFYKPRRWADMSVFHICRAFRTVAIQYYGEFGCTTIPFNPRLDRIVIHAEQLDCQGSKSPMFGYGYYPCLHVQEEFNMADLMSRDGVYMTPNTRELTSLWNKPTELSPDFLEKVKHVILLMHDRNFYDIADWASLWKSLSNAFGNAQILKIDICHVDACGVPGDSDDEGASHDTGDIESDGYTGNEGDEDNADGSGNEWHEGDAADEGHHDSEDISNQVGLWREPKDYYKVQDLWVL